MKVLEITLLSVLVSVHCANKPKSADHGQHGADYDHEAMLGGDAEQYKNMPVEKAKERLAMLVPTIDKNGDGEITKQELKDHVVQIHNKFIDEHVTRTWGYYDDAAVKHGKITWNDHVQRYYHAPDGQQLDADQLKRQARDKRRWQKADSNKDNALEKEEYTCFIHPEECGTTKEIWVLESLEDMDKNGDGKVSFDEYMAEMFPHIKTIDESEPWVVQEKKTFNERDTDNDGKLNLVEMTAWFSPEGYDRAEAEAFHLIGMADDDKDEKLSLDEILKHHDVFIASQVTNYGKDLKHDPGEL